MIAQPHRRSLPPAAGTLLRWGSIVVALGGVGALLYRLGHSDWLAMLINAWLQP